LDASCLWEWPLLAKGCLLSTAPERSALQSIADPFPGDDDTEIFLERRRTGCYPVSALVDVWAQALGPVGNPVSERRRVQEKEHFPCLGAGQGIHTWKKLFFIVKVESGPVAGMADLCPAGRVAAGVDFVTLCDSTFFSRF
jgi:hypothetical protein